MAATARYDRITNRITLRLQRAAETTEAAYHPRQ